MKEILTLLFVTFLLFSFCGEKCCDKTPPLVPMEDFFKNPVKTSFQLSPDGNSLAFLKPWENRMNVYVQKIGEEQDIRITGATERDIPAFFWANNERIAYIQDKGGDENFRLYAVNVDGSNFKELTPFEKTRVQIIDDLEDNPQEMIIGLNKRNPQVFDAYRINIESGEMSMIAENPGNISGWVTDHDGKLRIATTTDGVNTGILYRKTEKDEFELIIQTNFRQTFSPLFMTFDNKDLYVSTDLDRDKAAIYKYDLEKKELGELIYEHPEVDVDNLIKSKKRKKITGVSYYTDKRHYHFFDEERKSIQTFLETNLPDYEAVIVSSNKNEDKFLVRTYSDRSLGAYYFYDLSSKKLTKLVDVSPWLNEKHLAHMKPVSYQSSDGLTINGYLTLPVGKDPKNLPVVINPHGGPWVRDHWGFNPEIQFLANRGYAVLQMNYRGSTGYGKTFWEKGFKEWGKKMQDDVSDGVQWLIKQGIADPKKVAIYGGSYGGYAVLAGVTFTPELYCCGVDYVGVSNIFTLFETLPPYWEQGRQMMYEMIGNPETDSAFIKEISPIFHIDKIKVPLLIAQGANDPRVKKEHSDQIVEALKAKNINVEYLVKDNEGHGFRNEENKFDFYRSMEKFLGKHLGGRVEKTQ